MTTFMSSRAKSVSGEKTEPLERLRTEPTWVGGGGGLNQAPVRLKPGFQAHPRQKTRDKKRRMGGKERKSEAASQRSIRDQPGPPDPTSLPSPHWCEQAGNSGSLGFACLDVGEDRLLLGGSLDVVNPPPPPFISASNSGLLLGSFQATNYRLNTHVFQLHAGGSREGRGTPSSLQVEVRKMTFCFQMSNSE